MPILMVTTMQKKQGFLQCIYLLTALLGMGTAPTSWAEKEPTAAAKEQPLVLGVFPRRRASSTIELFGPLASYLSQQLGREVKLETAKDFDTFWQNVAARRYDIVHYNQLHYIESHEKYHYDLFAINEEFGSKTISSAIIVRKDSGIRSLQDLKGKKIVFGGDKRAIIAYVINKILLNRAGLKDGDYSEILAKNPPNAIFSVFVKQADAVGVGDNGLKLPIVTSQIKTDEMLVLAQSEPLPSHPWAVKRELDDALKHSIGRILLGLTDTPEGRKILDAAELTAISKAQDADFDVFRHLIKEAEKL